LHVVPITDGFYETRTAATARYSSDDTTKEAHVKMFGLSHITRGENIQMLPALDCDYRRDVSAQSMAYQVQSLLHNFHMLPQVQLRLSIASNINKHYGQNTKNKAATNQNNNKLFISHFLRHSAMDNSRRF
jgi:hypothetical protein